MLATRRTEVRFLYDRDTLYIGAILYDPEPDRLITNELKRDFGGSSGDGFGLILDTFQDRRSAFGFTTNPGGAQRESLGYENGRRNDANWHGVWFVKTKIRADGWSLEYAIPFKTLRFPENTSQVWGMNMVRWARRGPFGRAGDGGVDVKWGITSSLLLDASWRTDFSQVEADEQQINLTRFSQFFSEKREFFLESPAAFQIGVLENENENPRRDLVPFFSRRIGLSADGRPVPVLGGLRLTGRSRRQGLGVLTMPTEDFEGRPGDNFTVARVSRDVSSSATVAGFYFGREAMGSTSFTRVGGFDVRLRPRSTVEIEGFAMRSATAGLSGDWAGRAGFRLDTQLHRARGGILHIGDAFRHDLGFVRRRGVGTAFGQYARVFRPRNPDGRVREYRVGGEAESTTDAGYSTLLTRVGQVNYEMLFADGGEVRTWARSTFERSSAPFDLGSLTVRPGDYTFDDVGLEFRSNRSASISGSVEASAGEFWTGRQRQADWSVTPRMFLNAFVQYNGETDTWLSNVRYNLVHRPLSDFYVVCNETHAPRAAAEVHTHARVLMYQWSVCGRSSRDTGGLHAPLRDDPECGGAGRVSRGGAAVGRQRSEPVGAVDSEVRSR